MDRFQRFDASRLSKTRKTPSGGLRIDARLTRIGVLEYHRADGSIQKELRSPEEVFKPESLASLRDAPVTDLHPTEMVGPSNWKALSIGHLSEVPHKDGPYVSGEVAIQDQAAIEAVERGDRKEISCGYLCRLDMTPGTYQGQAYDAVQREITYNHIALGPSGWGRAGSEVSLRLDSNSALAQFDTTTLVEKDTSMTDVEIKLDGLTVKLSKEAAEIVTKELARLDGKIKTLETDLGKANGDLAKAKEDLEKASDPKAIQAKVDARVALEASARKVLGKDEDLKGKTDQEIRVAVVSKALPAVKLDGKSEDFVAGLFESACAAEPRTDASLADAQAAALEAAKSKKVNPQIERENRDKRNREAYKGTGK